MDLPTAVLLVVLVALVVMIVIVLEHRLSRIRRLRQSPAPEAIEPGPDEEAVTSEVAPPVLAAEPEAVELEPEAPPEMSPDREPEPVEQVSHILMQADTELAYLTTVRVDPPWLECTFEPTRAFGSVKQLFERELELLEHTGGTFDQAAFVDQWQRIFAAGLWIRVDPEEEHISQFLLHVHPDGTARLRYG